MNLGGGVGTWIRADTDYETIKSPFKAKEIESQTLLLPDLDLIIMNVYRPHGDKDTFQDTLMSHLDKLILDHPTLNIIMLGDFNIDLAKRTEHTESFIENTIHRGFLQQVTDFTRCYQDTKTLIDHVYSRSKKPSRSDIIQEDLSDHNLILTTYLDWHNSVKKVKITKRWFDESAYSNLKILLGAEEWKCLDDMTLEQSTDHLIERITEAMDIVAPIETKEVGLKKITPWMTGGIKKSIATGRSMFKKGKCSAPIKIEYKRYKKVLDKVIKTAKNNYYEDTIRDAGPDTRKLWSILNEVIDRKQCRHKMPNRFIIDGKTVRDKTNIANAFNIYFASIGEQMANEMPTESGYEEYLDKVKQTYINQMVFREVDETDISCIMRLQQPKLSCGIDTINNKIVKLCHKQLTVPMTKIINQSMTEGKVPSHFKKALIKPLYKKGPANICGNYRPVSLLPSLSKILEKAVCQQLNSFLDRYQILCQSQYGFRPKNQTTHVVHNMMNYITQHSIQNKVCIATYIDLSKAFDCLQYENLFKKLECIGLATETIDWFKDYLSGRKQQVDIDGKTSDWLDVKLGVPQGSILGPILFLIYMNDINICDTTVTYTKFADDTTILSTGNTLAEACDMMNKALVNVDRWFRRNKLNLNPSKTRYMIFNCTTDETELVKINNQYIERVWHKGNEKSFKLVGIHVDEKLTWNSHIDAVAKKMDHANYALRKASKELVPKNKKLLYSGLVHSHLVYGLPIWGFARKGRLNKLLVKQKHSIRKIHNLRYRDHTLPHFLDNRILQLPELVEQTTLSYTMSGISEKSPWNVKRLWEYQEQSRDLRDRGIKLHYTVTPKQWINNLSPISSAKLWNNSPIDTKCKPLHYKIETKKYYLDKYKSKIDQEK